MKYSSLVYIIGVITICSCAKSTKSQEQTMSVPDSDKQSSYAGDTVQIDQSILDGTETVPVSNEKTSSQSQTSSSTKGSSYRYTPPSAVMDDDEDAYEEGRALREEDRHNGTRTHEGGGYNDCDDDYDDGYDE